MNQSGYDSMATPYLRGSWDWGGSGDMMTDADGDGVWQVIRQVIGGASTYLPLILMDLVDGISTNLTIQMSLEQMEMLSIPIEY